MRIQTNLSECIVPVWNPKMHNHQSEVIGEGVRYEEPLAREILEPNLRFPLRLPVDEGQPSVPNFRVDIKCSNVLAMKYVR